jgi:hypothetical protein
MGQLRPGRRRRSARVKVVKETAAARKIAEDEAAAAAAAAAEAAAAVATRTAAAAVVRRARVLPQGGGDEPESSSSSLRPAKRPREQQAGGGGRAGASPRASNAPPTHEELMMQQVLDGLQSSSFAGVRWALHQLAMLSGTATKTREFTVQSCPDVLVALIDVIASWLRRPPTPLTHTDEAALREHARRVMAASQIIRNLSIKGSNLEAMAHFEHLVPALVALAHDLPPQTFSDGSSLNARPTRDDAQLTFISERPSSHPAHPVWENVMATLALLSPALQVGTEHTTPANCRGISVGPSQELINISPGCRALQVAGPGGSHVCLPLLLRALWAEHKIISSHALYAIWHLSMADNSISIVETILPDLLDKLVVLLHHEQVEHADIQVRY